MFHALSVELEQVGEETKSEKEKKRQGEREEVANRKLAEVCHCEPRPSLKTLSPFLAIRSTSDSNKRIRRALHRIQKKRERTAGTPLYRKTALTLEKKTEEEEEAKKKIMKSEAKKKWLVLQKRKKRRTGRALASWLYRYNYLYLAPCARRLKNGNLKQLKLRGRGIGGLLFEPLEGSSSEGKGKNKLQ